MAFSLLLSLFNQRALLLYRLNSGTRKTQHRTEQRRPKKCMETGNLVENSKK